MNAHSDQTSPDSYADKSNLANVNDFDEIMLKHKQKEQESGDQYEKELIEDECSPSAVLDKISS